MNKLTEVQKQKLDVLSTTVDELSKADISFDVKPYIEAVRTAGQDFRDSLPFKILDIHLENWWSANSQMEDVWQAKTLLEDELLILVRNVQFLIESKTIYDFSGALENVGILIERTQEVSDEEYPG